MNSSGTQDSHSAQQRRWRFSFRMTVLVMAILPLLLLPGCGGCSKDDPATAKKKAEEAKRKKAEEERKKKEKKKPRFELGRLDVQPTDEDTTLNFVKYGHWHTGSQRMRANHEDFLAEISSQAVDRYARPIRVENTDFQIKMTRPASLPKGQVMNFEMIYYVPASMAPEGKSVSLHSRLLDRRSGREMAGTPLPTVSMKGYQHYFLVLAADEKKYMFLKNLDSISPPPGDDDDMDRLLYYRVMLPEIKKRVPVPSHPMTWSAMAYVLWDGLIPNRFNPDQQEALIDWLHWGGQIIISGPNSLDTLRGSFLEEFLPATSTESVKLDSDAFKNMSDQWTVFEKKKNQKQPMKVSDERPLSGISLDVHKSAEVLIETAHDEPQPLVVERRIGRGRIVVTAFTLSDEPIVNWGTSRGNFDNFFNAVLMRRPARTYGVSTRSLMAQLDFDGYGKRRKDPQLLTTVRYFSRDLGSKKRTAPTTDQFGNPISETAIDYDVYGQPNEPAKSEHLVSEDNWHYGGFESDEHSGVGGWNDRGGSAAAASAALNEAAGISVPEASFVFRALVVYIFVLVPLNWLIFWLIGRVEWAWIAAPLIAIAGAMAVIHYAQLDIGFARSRTEIAVLEVYGGHDRAHLTRYTALYTSLSEFYDFEFSDKSAVAQPFASRTNAKRDSSITTVSFHRDKGVSLKGFKVQSNDIGHVHSEQMYAMGGGLQLQGNYETGWKVQNGTDLDLQDVGILRRTETGANEVAWIGDLPAKKLSPNLKFIPPEGAMYLPQWEDSEVTKQIDDDPETDDLADGEVNLGRLIKLGAKKLKLEPNQVRLIGWTNKDLGGLKITPAASQVILRTFVIAHLQPGNLTQPLSDSNTKSDYWEDFDAELEDIDIDPDASLETNGSTVP